MKIAFSTLGCPSYSIKEIFSTAKDFGFDGVEIRGLNDHISAVYAAPFQPDQLAKTKERLQRSRLDICCFSSGACLASKDFIKDKEEIIAYMDLACQLNTPYVRVLGDWGPAPADEVDDELVLANLNEVLPMAEEKGITLLIETNGAYADTARLRQLLLSAKSDNVAALWDVHHPYRYAGETAEVTVQNLGAFIKHVHIKDSVMEEGKAVYKMLGEGDMPIDDMMLALRSINFEGYVCLEWVRRWMPGLDNAGIVFPQFANYMARYRQGAVTGTRLFDNKAGTGKYVWEKDTLIDLTFPQVLDKMVEEFPDQYAFRYTTLDYTRTYAEFRDDVDTFARALIAMGVKSGDHVAIWATNVPQWYITFWATTKIGAVLVTVNTAYKINELEYLLRQSDTHTLVMTDGFKDSDYISIIKELCPELETAQAGKPLHMQRLPFLRNIITVESKQPGCLSWKEALAMAEKVPVEDVYRRMLMINKHDVCNMQYTSGTTGFPKGVMLTHYNVVNNGKCIGDCMDLSTADRMMIQVP
ncbi:MAG: AMP-binding protein, partial [Christensenellaceae bacterium]|nr:AMP-binding protein [Christensenellaceae bacterium]